MGREGGSGVERGREEVRGMGEWREEGVKEGELECWGRVEGNLGSIRVKGRRVRGCVGLKG